MAKSKEKFNFTEAYLELEKINEWFLQEDIDLDEGLRKYRRGLELIKKCRERLKEAENQFHDIKKEFDIGEFREDETVREEDMEKHDVEGTEIKEGDVPF